MKLNESDIKYLTKKVQSYLNEEIEVVKKLTNAQKYELEEKAREAKELALFQEFKANLEKICQDAGVQCNVRKNYNNIYVTTNFGTDQCNGVGLNKEFFIPVATKSKMLYETLVESIGVSKHHGFMTPYGLVCYVPGSDSHSGMYMWGNHAIGRLDEEDPNELFEKAKNLNGLDKMNKFMLSTTAELLIAFHMDGVHYGELTFKAEYDEEGRRIIDKIDQVASDSYDSLKGSDGWTGD